MVKITMIGLKGKLSRGYKLFIDDKMHFTKLHIGTLELQKFNK